jgi:hypothetical protein
MDCIICYDASIHIKECSTCHTYVCTSCYNKWLRINVSKTCPHCRCNNDVWSEPIIYSLCTHAINFIKYNTDINVLSNGVLLYYITYNNLWIYLFMNSVLYQFITLLISKSISTYSGFQYIFV